LAVDKPALGQVRVDRDRGCRNARSDTADQVDVIRVEYYKCGGKKLNLGFFPSQFFHWRASMFRCTDEVLRLTLRDYEKFFGESMRRRLEDLIQAIRADPAQRARNREWLLEPGGPARTRIESYCWTPLDEHWQDLATDLWSLGRLHAGIGEAKEAKILFERALDIWKSHGHILAHVQANAIPTLEGELTRLSLRA
jgi:hypothetical protein